MKTPTTSDNASDFEEIDEMECAEEYLDEGNIANAIAFTWCPNPVKYHSIDNKKQYIQLLKHILRHSHTFFSAFCFVPELTKEGNIHIHGWYVLKDKIAYYKRFLFKCRQLGFIKIKSNVDKGWFQYLRKDNETMIGVLGEKIPIPYTHLTDDSLIRGLCAKKSVPKKTKEAMTTKSWYNFEKYLESKK